MPQSTAPAIRRLASSRAPESRFFLLATSLVAVATIAGGLTCLGYRTSAASVDRVLAPAGLVLLIAGLAQLRLVGLHWRCRSKRVSHDWSSAVRFTRRLSLGAFLTYLAVSAVGPMPLAGCVWLAAVAVWYTLLLLPLSASPLALEGWRKWSQNRQVRRLGWLVYASVLFVIGAEASLRMHRLASEQGWQDRSAPQAALGADAISLDLFVDHQSPSTGRVRLTSGAFRVAVVGDEATQKGIEHNGYLARVEQMLPGLEMVPVAVSHSWSKDAAGDLATRISNARADLVLVVLSMCEDLASPVVETTWFDWRQFELARRIAGPGTISDKPLESVAIAHEGDFESFLHSVTPQLAACRTPIDEPMCARWQQAFASLDRVLRRCRSQQVPVALVLVPGEFQVNRNLCETLARRTGWTSQQLDVELPQRKMASFAEGRDLPLIDLLPNLRLCRLSPYERNTTQWSEHGQTAAAAAIGGWLESRYGGQLAVAAQLTSAP